MRGVPSHCIEQSAGVSGHLFDTQNGIGCRASSNAAIVEGKTLKDIAKSLHLRLPARSRDAAALDEEHRLAVAL
jgi:hypothetical protein